MGVQFVKANSGTITCGSNNDILTQNGAATVSMWIFLRSTGGGGFSRLYERGTLTVSGIDTQFSGTNSFSTTVAGATNLFRTSANNAITLNAWHHFAMTWDGSTTSINMHMYVDGLEVAYANSSDGVSLVDNSTTTFRIGNTSTGLRSVDGFISEVAVWSSQLVQADITILANSHEKFIPLQVSPSTLKRYYPLDDFPEGISLSGTGTVIDRSSIGVNGSPSFLAGGADPTGAAEQILSYQ